MVKGGAYDASGYSIIMNNLITNSMMNKQFNEID